MEFSLGTPLGFALVALTGPGLAAGDLDPPGGPAPTPGPEPRVAVNAENTPGGSNSVFLITLPGSYFLTANVTGVSGEHGIAIIADGVTLDLNGFEVAGVPGSLNGIRTPGGQDSLAILNGGVRSWGGTGIDFGFADACRIEGVVVRDNLGDGIRTGPSSVIRGCVARGNGGDGITAGNHSVVAECTASSNTGLGISVPQVSLLDRCVAGANGGDGLVASTDCTIVGCQSSANGGDGVRVFSNCTVRDNTCSLNGAVNNAAGVHALNTNNCIEGNTVINNISRGIDVDVAGNLVIRNRASNNGALGVGNYALSESNSVGPIVTGADPITSVSPWANFAY